MSDNKIVYKERKSDGLLIKFYSVYCPACLCSHRFIVESDNKEIPTWEFNGDLDKPTFTPSLLVTWDSSNKGAKGYHTYRCHSYLTNGIWIFLNDCSHGLSGTDQVMIEFPDNYRV